MKNYWLIKSEPETYSWEDLEREKVGTWDGVRNYAARNNLRAMQLGDLCLFYYSVTQKSVIGICEVVKEAFQDPSDESNTWSAVQIKPIHKLTPISLATIKANTILNQMILLKNSRLSVQPVAESEYNEILILGSK